MSGVTNELVAWCRDGAVLHDARNTTPVVSSGEQVTAGCWRSCLKESGSMPAPAGLAASHSESNAPWLGAHPRHQRRRTHQALQGTQEVAVVAGFQGMHKETGPYHPRSGARVGHIGGRDRGRHQGGSLRHLYRRRWRVFDRSAGRAARQAHVQDCLRGNARACFARGQGHAGAPRSSSVWCIACAYSCARVS